MSEALGNDTKEGTKERPGAQRFTVILRETVPPASVKLSDDSSGDPEPE